MLGLAARNWKLFYRDRGVVFFSLLGPLIIIGLYILFLKTTVVPELPVTGSAAEELLNNWIMAGIIASALIHRRFGSSGGSRHANAPVGREDWTCLGFDPYRPKGHPADASITHDRCEV